MYDIFLRLAVGPNMVRSTPVMKFYDDYLKKVYNNDTNNKASAVFQNTKFGKNLKDLNEIQNFLEKHKLSDDQVEELFLDNDKGVYIACVLLANIPIDILKSNGILYKTIEDTLINSNDVFCWLLLGYFTGNLDERLMKQLSDTRYKLMYVENTGTPSDYFEAQLKQELNEGKDENLKKYFTILVNNQKRPNDKELNNWKYFLNRNYERHTISRDIDTYVDEAVSVIKNKNGAELTQEIFNILNKLMANGLLVNESNKLNVLKSFKNSVKNKILKDKTIIEDDLGSVKYNYIQNFDVIISEFKNGLNITGEEGNNTMKNTEIHIEQSVKKSRIIKAYTRYYIKNFLPNLVRKASPETMPVIVENGVQEVQNLLYGDNHIIDFSNPNITNQIKTDITNATNNKDLLSGGAADGLLIEDIAKKWSPIYKIPYQQMLDILKTQEQAGSIVEQEHTTNLEIAKEIARDHLVEAPDYYTHLENMEENFPSENVAVKPLPEPENMDLKTLNNPLPKDHVCDGSCGGDCQCHVQVEESLDNAPDGTIVPIKPQTVEDKLCGLGENVIVTIISEPQEVQPLNENEVKSMDFINDIAASIKR